MAGYIGAKVGTVTANAADIKGDISSTDTSPDLTLKNTTQEDSDGGRESTITFKGEQSGGEESTLAEIRASHDGTADDQKGDLIFKTNDGSDNNSPTERIRIDSGGNVHITDNANGPDAALHIEKTTPQLRLQLNGNSGYNTIESGGSNELIIGRSGTEQLRIDENGNIGLNETNPTADIHMTKADDINEIIMDANRPNAGQLIGRHRYYWNGTEVARMEGDAGSDTTNKDDGYLRFLARASGSSIAEKLRIDSDGLKFNGDTAAANALDDYEEGTWTPSFAEGSVTLQTNSAFYVKIGKLVHAGCRVADPTNTTSSGVVTMNGLPFTVNASYYNNNIGSVWGNLLGTEGSFYIYSGSSATSCSFYYGAGGSGAYNPVRYSNLSSTSNMIMRFHYMST